MNKYCEALGRVGVILIILLTSCRFTDPSAPPPAYTPIGALPYPTEIETIEITQGPTNEDYLQTPEAPLQPQTSLETEYYFDVDLDYDLKRLNVVQIISYTNNTDESISDLPILVPPAYQNDVFRLQSIQINQAFPGTSAKMEGAQIHVLLDPPLGPGKPLEISFTFDLHPKPGGMALGYTDRQMLLADWYPMIPPYQEGNGWVVNPPGFVGEYITYPISHFHLNLCIAPSRQALIVAASAPLVDEADNCYQYQHQYRRNISLGISPHYHVSTATGEDVTVNAYTFPEHAGLGMRTSNLALQAWETFNKLFGDNQRYFLSIVEADIFDGLETDGLIFISEWYFRTADPSPQNYYELLIVHETVHQWFYGFVHNNQALEPWLDEALATYSEYLFYEIHHPNLVDWWWDYRVASYAPEGPVNATIYDFNQYRLYINAVYLRGASFLHAAREEIGDQAFFSYLLHYVQSNADINHLRHADDFIELFFNRSDPQHRRLLQEYFQ